VNHQPDRADRTVGKPFSRRKDEGEAWRATVDHAQSTLPVPAVPAKPQASSRAVLTRRLVFFAVVAAVASGLTALLVAALAPGGWHAWKIVALTAFAFTTPWTGICAAHAVIGFAILVFCRDPIGLVFPAARDIRDDGPLPPTAVALTVRNESMNVVLAALGHLLDELDRRGVVDAVTAFILSDTDDGPGAASEEADVGAFAAARHGEARVRYRRRSTNVGMKAGNLMEFFDHHAAGFELAIVLDADSEMSADAVLRLVRAMQADTSLGIVQQLTVGRPTEALFPRVFQFGMRAGMRVWATGQAWWQGAEGPYWGHNAVLRIAPFRTHCRLMPLADGSTILSHDQVEAALMAASGWGVRVLPIDDGSLEGNPPALPEFIRRDARWLTGNLQYLHLLTAPGLRAMGRWQLAQAILMFVGAPLYVIFAVACAAGAASTAGPPARPWLVVTLAGAWLCAIYAPKLAGYVETLLIRCRRAAYGGFTIMACGAAAEFTFTLLLDPIMELSKTVTVIRGLLGFRTGWTGQNRASRRISWIEASRLLAVHTVFGLFLTTCLLRDQFSLMLAAPFGVGLLLAIPFCVLTSSTYLGRRILAIGLFATPEELQFGDRL
jgi:membrane glycosyltransferase